MHGAQKQWLAGYQPLYQRKKQKEQSRAPGVEEIQPHHEEDDGAQGNQVSRLKG